MKKIKVSEKTATYFEYSLPILLIVAFFLIPYLRKQFDFLNVISFKLWDCPGSFLCGVPIIKGLQDPAQLGVMFILLVIISAPVLLIWFLLFEVEKKIKKRK